MDTIAERLASVQEELDGPLAQTAAGLYRVCGLPQFCKAEDFVPWTRCLPLMWFEDEPGRRPRQPPVILFA